MFLVQILKWICWFLRAFFKDRVALATENLVYRQQLATFKCEHKRPKIFRVDRILWALLSEV